VGEPTERFVDASDDLRIHAVVYGDPTARRPVLCIPGLTQNARAFEDVAPGLALERAVAVVSLRGRGRSGRDPTGRSYALDRYVDDVLVVLDALGWGEAVLLGTSLGGLTALWANWRAPERVAAIVLNDVGTALQEDGRQRISKNARDVAPARDWGEAAAHTEALGAVVYPDFGPDDWLRLARQRYVETDDGAIVPDYDPAIASGRLADDDPVLVFSAAATKPVLLLRGELTDLLAPETVELMRAVAPGMRVVEVPDRGHSPTLTEPVAQAALAQFLAAF
jgi:pimeloyl-ACP methyl ester carboxylesterase